MKTEKFIEGYKKATNKESYIKKHIVNDYIPYAQKVAETNKIVAISMYKEVNGKNIFWINTPLQYELMVIAVIKLYTDIELGENEEILNSFDALEKEGLSGEIFKAIGSDYSSFNTVLKMAVNDAGDNNNIMNYLDTKIDATKFTIDSLTEILQSPSIQKLLEEKKE